MLHPNCLHLMLAASGMNRSCRTLATASNVSLCNHSCFYATLTSEMLCGRFTTDSSYKEFEQMRVSMEPLTYKHGVDVFFYGHVHAYERTAPMVCFPAVLQEHRTVHKPFRLT